MAGDEALRAADVSRKEFANAFRGYDQYEVRAFLATVSAQMGVLEERERGLRERLAELDRRRPPADRTLPDEEIEAALGAEAVKVLHAAREGAAEMRARAEENVARMVREAQDEAQAIRAEAAGLLSQRTEEADAAGMRILESAQQQGREMVAEAQAVRERMLKDLSRRRRHAEAQLQVLLAGRERLLEALDMAGRGVGVTTEQLASVELSDLPALEPMPEQRPAPEEDAPPPVAAAPPAPSVEASEEEPVEEQSDVSEDVVVLAAEGGGRARPVARPPDDRRGSLRLLRRRGEPASTALDDAVEGVRLIPAEPMPATDAAPTVDAPVGVEEPAAEVEVVTTEAAPSETDPESESEGEADARPVTDVFARLRAERAAAAAALADTESTGEAMESSTETADQAEAAAETEPADRAPSVEEASEDEPVAEVAVDEEPPARAEPTTETPAVVDAAFEGRDAALEPAERALTRSLKRALADEQNEVLDALRRLKGAPRIEVLLPDETVHRARYERVAAGPLTTGAEAGAVAMGGSAPPVDELAAGFADEVASDIRHRIETALDAGVDDDERLVEAISAAYREWKSGRIERVARHHTVAAYGAGAYAASPDGALQWVVDPAEGACPDCDDNALAGPTPKGTAYPTGQLHPPAHVGCRCLVRPVP